jgi:hypothetical protein
MKKPISGLKWIVRSVGYTFYGIMCYSIILSESLVPLSVRMQSNYFEVIKLVFSINVKNLIDVRGVQ